MPHTLLIIEDEPLLGQELTRHYGKEGWEVEWARTLGDARELLKEGRLEPLLVLSDMNLPDGNALDFMEDIKNSLVHAEWIFLTG